MIKDIFGGEALCGCEKPHSATRFVVLTGGPGAGKTAVLEYVRKILCSHVAILPEAAGILFQGGFWRIHSKTGMKSAQRAIYHVQNELQNLVALEKKWPLALCDRGTLDGIAYWPDSETSFLKSIRSSKAAENSKYLAVIHLESPSVEFGYNHGNPLRIETADEAKSIDSRIKKAWIRHPNYFFIESKLNFTEKVNIASQIISTFVPRCCLKGLDGTN